MDTRTPNPFRLPGVGCLSRRLAALAPCRVRALLDLPYVAGGDVRNKLDLYLPDRPSFPVTVFVHGGSWSRGDKSQFGHVGTFLARHGIGTVVANYSLSPKVRHPAHVRDVAAAFAWAWRNVAEFGGDPGRLSAFGHSAGGHLVSLLATDERHLRPWGLGPGNIQGVVSISGVYRVHWNVSLYGLGHVFRGQDRRAASPLCHVRPGCPPFLILYAQRDTWTLAGQARKMHARVQAVGGYSRLVPVAGQSHDTILASAVMPHAPHGRQIVRFLLDA
jgi:acetyl esterase/lipase